MKYEELEYEAQYLAENQEEHNYNKDTLQEIYDNTDEFIENDEIADWEEGFMQGYAQA